MKPPLVGPSQTARAIRWCSAQNEKATRDAGGPCSPSGVAVLLRGFHSGTCSSKTSRVDILRAYSKRSDLLEDLDRALRGLARATKERPQERRSVNSTGRANRQWTLRDRLSEHDVRKLVKAFKAGTPKKRLAKQYNVSESSVKRLLRNQREAEWIVSREMSRDR